MSDSFALQKPFRRFSISPDTGLKPSLWFVLTNKTIFLTTENGKPAIPLSTLPPVPAAEILYSRCIGAYGDTTCMVLQRVDNAPSSGPLFAATLREAHAFIGDDLWTIAGRASQILRWKRDHQFCGRCGTPMEEDRNDVLRRCPQCGFFTYPRLSPAVIMSIIRDDAILLGRSPHFPPGMYSTLAGFVEPGETLEEAVAREVKEEVNIDITDIRYVASQPWPFPHSLMIGFTARYAGGLIEVDGREIEHADWFTPAEMPRLPPRMSIARWLIELYLSGNTNIPES
jgi:NAD+ diphosphatase